MNPPSVAWVTADWHDVHGPGGLSWNRCVLPARALNRFAGWRTGVFRHIGTDDTGRIQPTHTVPDPGTRALRNVAHRDGWDIIIFQRWTDRDAAPTIRAARAAGQIVGNDIDDWLWGARSWNPVHNSIDHARRNEGDNQLHYTAALKAGAFTICSTPPLANAVARRLPGRVVVAHNMIDLESWGEPNPPRWPPRTVGFVGSPVYHVGDLAMMRGVLGPFLERHGLTFVAAGGRQDEPLASELAGLDPALVERRDPQPLSLGRYRRIFDGIDIGIAPLEAYLFNDCKSWLKLSELSAAGIPSVVSDAAAYREFGHPYRARSARDWRWMLDALVTDPEAWENLREWQLGRVADLDWRVAYKEWEAVLLGLWGRSGSDLGDVAFS